MFSPDYFGEGYFASDYFPPSGVVVEQIVRSSGGGRVRHFAPIVSVPERQVLKKISAKKRYIEEIEKAIVSTESRLRKVYSKDRTKILFKPPQFKVYQEDFEIQKIIKALEIEEERILGERTRLEKKKRQEEEILLMLMDIL